MTKVSALRDEDTEIPSMLPGISIILSLIGCCCGITGKILSRCIGNDDDDSEDDDDNARAVSTDVSTEMTTQVRGASA